jgi:hypothetical protein
MTNQTCAHGKSAPDATLESLPVYQGGSARHKCPVCAYEAGVQEGLRRARAAIQDLEREAR